MFLVNSFDCQSDSTLGVGEFSSLIYSAQSLILFNIDGALAQLPWDTSKFDSIQQIRWSSYHRAYLIMTVERFFLFTLYPTELRSIKQFQRALQYFTCYQTNLWFVSLSLRTKRQSLHRFDLTEWHHEGFQLIDFSLNRLGLHQSDRICALECDLDGRYLALLIAERNETLTGDIRRRRRLILLALGDLSPVRTIYFDGTDDLYWMLTSTSTGWLLGQSFDHQLTLLDNRRDSKTISIKYHKELRNLATSMNGQYLLLRTVDSLDIYQIDRSLM